MTNNYAIELLKKEEMVLADELDILNAISSTEEARQLGLENLNSVRNSIKILEENIEDKESLSSNINFTFNINAVSPDNIESFSKSISQLLKCERGVK